ncbi:PPA1309 family protein [Nocardia crassostreae]|uniref:PPA1309 family protein n=1 Tax=Nocardia crassostreae TaxID=53428 RepID=UPI000833E34D|nr:PPA1309 family protein [Nocardia crassostreae]
MNPEQWAASALYRCIREVAEYVDGEGWNRPPQMFALVPTADLVAAEPSLLDQVDAGDALTPIAQEPFPEDIAGEADARALDEFLATTSWPPSVEGCVLVQQIVVLPPAAESALDDAIAPLLADREAADRAARRAAVTHPGRRDARLFVGVLRDGTSLSLLQVRPSEDEEDPWGDLELRTAPNLAPNLVEALRHTLENDPDEF